ncbi:MAG TPA: alternative ribosome rescue aminoacyl-tRNA hydrolase ArfB [Tepidisphaeraceae bacterium]|nr:alternative ribosome rescue aminoacyl-tRNA hydrolase ArfB [Tepidisphaeraceae bacterium]
MSDALPDKTGGGGDIEVAPGVTAPAEALRFQYSRSSGPGGQNVNKLNTKAELWVAIASLRGLRADAVERLKDLAGKRLTRQEEIHIVAETNRTQDANRTAVMDRLRELLVQATYRPKTRRPTRPTRGSKRRRLETKRHRGNIKAGRGHMKPQED